MRLALLCNEYPPQPHGGIGTFTQSYARAMVRDGHAVTVLGLGGRDAEHDDQGVRVVSVAQPPPGRLISLRRRRRLRDVLAAEVTRLGIESVEVPDYEGLLPFAFPHCPVVVRLHATATLCARWGAPRAPLALRWFERATLRRHRNWIAPTRWVAAQTQRVLQAQPEALHVIANPAPEAVAPGAAGLALPPADGPWVVFVGTLYEFKGALRAARVLREVLAVRPDVRGWFIGGEKTIAGAPSSVALREAVGPRADRLVFPGRIGRAQVAEILRRAAVFLFPNPNEAFPMVFLEAMQHGAPIVGPARGCGPEILRDGATALLADPDDVPALATAVLRLLGDPILAARLRQEAWREVADRYAMARCVADSLAVHGGRRQEAAR